MLEFPAGVPEVRRYQGLLLFDGTAGDLQVRCAVTELALLHGQALPVASDANLRKLFAANWEAIKRIAPAKFERGEITRGAVVVISTKDLDDGRNRIRATAV
jgi:hypothetical protein